MEPGRNRTISSSVKSSPPFRWSTNTSGGASKLDNRCPQMQSLRIIEIEDAASANALRQGHDV
jgi:hypothetical protein